MAESPLPPPSLNYLRRMALRQVAVTRAKIGCQRQAHVTFDALGLPGRHAVPGSRNIGDEAVACFPDRDGVTPGRFLLFICQQKESGAQRAAHLLGMRRQRRRRVA